VGPSPAAATVYFLPKITNTTTVPAFTGSCTFSAVNIQEVWQKSKQAVVPCGPPANRIRLLKYKAKITHSVSETR